MVGRPAGGIVEEREGRLGLLHEGEVGEVPFLAPRELDADRGHQRHPSCARAGAHRHFERLHEAPQAGRKRLRVRKTEYTAEGVMARQAGLKTRKLTQKTLPIPGEIRKVHATVAAAHRPHQRNRQNVHKIVATRIPKPRVGNIP